MLLSLIAPLVSMTMVLTVPLEVPIEKTHHEVHNNILCSCVQYVNQYRGDIPMVDAVDMPVATSAPREGAVAKMYYPHSGEYHVALVLEVGDGWLRVRDANYVPCEETERVITLPDRVIGYL